MSENHTHDAVGMPSSIDFCTLGMFIIDEIHFTPPIPSVYDVLGGAGSYSALGARIFSPGNKSNSVGWIVDAGSDFPNEVKSVIDSWGTSCLIRNTPDRLTTRGWNGYGENERRDFRYTTPKLRLDHNSLDDNLLSSKSFHLICSPLRCQELVRNILKRRQSLKTEAATIRPLFIWEPVPDLCIESEFENCLDTLKLVDVVSPNHAELCGFFGKVSQDQDGNAARETIEHCCQVLLNSGIRDEGNGVVVVRAGKDGCYISSRQNSQWISAYHQTSDKVVDPTGGGNTFLGGLAVALARDEHGLDFKVIQKAAIWGSVAASFAIEQVGMPSLHGTGIDESWNGERAMDRADKLQRQLEIFA